MQELQTLLSFALVITIMLGGISMIVGGPTLTGRVYNALYSNCLRKPLLSLLRAGKRGSARLFRALWRHFCSLPVLWQVITIVLLFVTLIVARL